MTALYAIFLAVIYAISFYGFSLSSKNSVNPQENYKVSSKIIVKQPIVETTIKPKTKKSRPLFEKITFLETPKDTKQLKDPSLLSQKTIKFSYDPVQFNDTNNGDFLIVTFVDIHYYKTAQIWYKRMVELGYKNFKVYALDNLVYDELQKDAKSGKLEPYNVDIVDDYIQMDESYRMFEIHTPDFWEQLTKGPELSHYNYNNTAKIWKLRLDTCYKLLKANKSIMLTDIDSIWNWYVDLTKLPSNFDAFHSTCWVQPADIIHLWGFGICAGLALYRPTQATMNLWDRYMHQCRRHCDDQRTLNSLYHSNGIEFFDVNKTHQEKYHKSPLKYHKIGWIEKMYKKEVLEIGNREVVKFDYISLDTPMRIMIVDPVIMRRGGKPEDCKDSWIMNPTTPFDKGWPHTTPRAVRKYLMFQKFENCTVQSNKTHTHQF